MIGAIIGDIAGSIYEFNNIKTKEFPLFNEKCEATDDSLMTIATGSAFLKHVKEGLPLEQTIINEMRRIGRMYPYPMGGFGGMFFDWIWSRHPVPYFSFGNGSAMRVSPCAEIAETMDEALMYAELSAKVTHNHPEGIKGAKAVAAAIFMAKHGSDKREIREYINSNYYHLNRTVDELRIGYEHDVTCMGTIPHAITAFLESESFEDAVRTAVSMGGDCDTLTDITCSIAWPFYAQKGIDATMEALKDDALRKVPDDLRSIVEEWEEKYGA